MLSPQTKRYISEEIQALLQEINDDELPKGEISFILHVDGAEFWSWANIRNESEKNVPVPSSIACNLTK